jgi:uncharacterized lipoprotein YddW (UPF0748 family)
MGSSSMGRRAVLLLLSVTLLLGVLPAAAGAAVGPACPAGAVPATAFTDTVRSVHRSAIDCGAWWGITSGRTATRYAPDGAITRGQTAAMIARLLRSSGRAPSTVPSAGFTDTVGHRFAADIDLLAHLGIVRGVSTTSFAPETPVDRQQMASFIAAMFARGYAAPLPTGPVPFRDVSATNVHRDAIGRLVAADITGGTTATTYAPTARVTRDQMASFLTRSTSRLVTARLATLPTTRPGARDPYATRTRGAWVHLFDGSLKTRRQIRTVVDELAAADVNAIFAQVARRHDAYYTSSVLPRTPDPTLEPGLDVLDELLRVAHARGIEVHAWISVAPTYHGVYDGLPRPAGWVYREHGANAPVAQRWVTRTRSGTWSDYLDPGLRPVQDHLAAVVGELAANYALDGIHLDYVRYQSANHGYHPAALARYRAETGASIDPLPAANDPGWSNWRRAQTREMVRRARAAIRASGRDVELSAAVISWGAGPANADRAGFTRTRTYTETFQDWDRWVRDGEVDMVLPMNYFRAHDADQARWFEQWLRYEQQLAAGSTSRVVPGIAGYLNRPAAGLDQMQRAMARTDGAAMYSYQQPTLDGGRGIWGRLAGSRWGYPPVR